MASATVNEQTRREWRELGYYYTCDNERLMWVLRGSRVALLGFAQDIRKFASDPKNSGIGEHLHLGPYKYLEIGTWNEPQITDHWIAGPPSDMIRLAGLIENKLEASEEGVTVSFRSEFAPVARFDLCLEVEDENFDPASVDSSCS